MNLVDQHSSISSFNDKLNSTSSINQTRTQDIMWFDCTSQYTSTGKQLQFTREIKLQRMIGAPSNTNHGDFYEIISSNLKKRNLLMLEGAVVCKACDRNKVEMVEHLFFKCEVAVGLWEKMERWLEMSYFPFVHIKDHL